MPSPLVSSIGAIILLSAGNPATYNATGYAALTYTKIGNVGNIGERAEEWETDEFPDLETGSKQQAKTWRGTPSFDIEIGYDGDDTGLVLLKAAFASPNNYSVKITHADGEVDYFQAKITKLNHSALDGTFRKLTVGVSIQPDTNGVYVLTV
jgi:hypothetical protein